MVAPVAKGIIVATTLLLAAGLAAYENEQVRAWIETQRRKIAIVLTGHDGASSETERERKADDMALELRDEVIRRHREEIIERAKKEGVAVDLDELDAVERMYEQQQEKEAEKGELRRGSAQSFDEMVGSDGMLRDRDVTTGTATGAAAGIAESLWSGLRQRGLQGLGRGASFANPFDDEAQFLFDQELVGAGGEELAGISRSAHTSSMISAEPELGKLVDVHESPYKSDEELDADINEAIRRSLEETAQRQQHLVDVDDEEAPVVSESFHSSSDRGGSQPVSQAPSLQSSIYQSYYYGGQPSTSQDNPSHPPYPGNSTSLFHSAVGESQSPETSTTFYIPSPATLPLRSEGQHGSQENEADSDDALTPAGTLTPTTEAGFSVDGDSLYGEPSINLGDMLDSRLREQNRSQAHEVDDDSDEFSVIGGTSTPESWTDVESVDGYDDVENDEEVEAERTRRSREGTSSTLR